MSKRLNSLILMSFLRRSAESDEAFDYTVAWVDCLAQGDSLGRGLLMRGNHAQVGELTAKSKQLFSVPIDAPNALLNNLTMKTFNVLYYHKQRQKVVRTRQHYEPFFYPLDSIGNWNRIYGKRGFLQYQFVLPFDGDTRVILRIFEENCRLRNGLVFSRSQDVRLAALTGDDVLSAPRGDVGARLSVSGRRRWGCSTT